MSIKNKNKIIKILEKDISRYLYNPGIMKT